MKKELIHDVQSLRKTANADNCGWPDVEQYTTAPASTSWSIAANPARDASTVAGPRNAAAWSSHHVFAASSS